MRFACHVMATVEAPEQLAQAAETVDQLDRPPAAGSAGVRLPSGTFAAALVVGVILPAHAAGDGPAQGGGL